MLCQITSVLDYPINNGSSEVANCFLIEATPIVEESETLVAITKIER